MTPRESSVLGAGGYLEYIPIESMYGLENNIGSAGQASYMACHAFWMWWLHEALATADRESVMVMNVAVWGGQIEHAVRYVAPSRSPPRSQSQSPSRVGLVFLLLLATHVDPVDGTPAAVASHSYHNMLTPSQRAPAKVRTVRWRGSSRRARQRSNLATCAAARGAV